MLFLFFVDCCGVLDYFAYFKVRVEVLVPVNARLKVSGVFLCIYVCMVTHIARLWVNRIRLPILLVVS